MHLAGRIAAGIVVFLVLTAVAVLLSAGSLLNGTIKDRILHSVNSGKGISLTLGTIRYNLFRNRISCDSLRLAVKGIDEAGDSIRIEANAFSCSDVNWLRVLLGKGFSCGTLVVEGVRGFVSSTTVQKRGKDIAMETSQDGGDARAPLFPLTIGDLAVRDGRLFRVTHSLAGVSHDSVSWSTAELRDVNLESLSTRQLRRVLGAGRMELQAARASFQIPGSRYRVGFASLRISAAESLILVDSLNVTPSVSDDVFFAASTLRSTRYRALLGRLMVHGVNVAAFMEGKNYTAHAIRIHNPSVSIVVDMRKEADADPVQMPNEIVTSMQERLRIDSVLVNGGAFEYEELYPYSSTPASLRWTGVRLAATGISNGKGGHDTSVARVEASALFQNTARTKVTMLLPLSKQDFTLECQGNLYSLPLPALNSFLEIAERTKIISGEADSIRFAFSAANGQSMGTVWPVYRDLKIEVLAMQSGRSDGLPQKISSFIANEFKIRDSNMPEGPDPPKNGHIQYVRKPGDPFFKFVWFSLRGALKPVVGF